MRMNLEQASKVKTWTPTRLNNGEGRSERGRNRQEHPRRSTGVVRMAREEGPPRNVGGPQLRGVAALDAGLGRQELWESERSIVAVKPGNAGGAKGPHFWVLSKKPRTGRLA